MIQTSQMQNERLPLFFTSQTNIIYSHGNNVDDTYLNCKHNMVVPNFKQEIKLI
jgi:hypothetical protein